MQKFDGISFVWALILLSVIALFYGIRAFLGYRAVASDAASDYEFKAEQDMLDHRLTREGYVRAYRRFHSPRSTAYVAGGLAAILILTAPVLSLIQFIYETLWVLGGKNRVFEPGFLVWQFVLFFAVIGMWTAIGYVAARRYHRRAPSSLRDEMLREMDT